MRLLPCCHATSTLTYHSSAVLFHVLTACVLLLMLTYCLDDGKLAQQKPSLQDM
ncbi:hypothetical protein [uncultured Phocaeicola sp.]|uniref:hypothetical protein n=1 Tax=uncultured Phocaeicola sp. TaxID=990718 RepID=UPI00262CCE5E|nr:hypothetical protein [uncultured Phocaeicola sp.]